MRIREIYQLTKVIHVAGDNDGLAHLHREGLGPSLEAGWLLLLIFVVEAVLVVVLSQTCEEREQNRDERSR